MMVMVQIQVMLEFTDILVILGQKLVQILMVSKNLMVSMQPTYHPMELH